MKYVIWSFKKNAWWGPDECGYRSDLAAAGRYDAATAGRIMTNSVFPESVAIIESVAEEHGQPEHHPYGWRF